MQYLLFEDHSHFDLLPLTFTRPVCDLRIGIDKISEKWNRILGHRTAVLAYDYLGNRFNNFHPDDMDTVAFNGKFVPEKELVTKIMDNLAPETFIVNENNEVLAFRGKPALLGEFDGIITVELLLSSGMKEDRTNDSFEIAIRFPWDIFRQNGACIRKDFEEITAGRKSYHLNDNHTIVYGHENIFIEEGARIRAAVLNAEDGPIYIGKNVDIQEGAMVHGTHAFCEHSVLNMGAKMRGDSTIGPHSKVGGEIANSVVQGYSNKSHDGYLGNSVIGYWCNLGADTNTSNLKNNYSEVRLWNYRKRSFLRTGQTFCGLIMGDHSKCGINTMFNTGTVVGVSANIFGAGYPRNFIPSFSWGGASGLMTYGMNKVKEVAEIVMARRKVEFDDEEKAILQTVFDLTKEYRNWEKD